MESEIFKKEREALESKSGEGSGDKLPFDPLQLDLAEALHDSPFLHEKLLAMEESVHALVSKLNGILKLAKGMQKHSQMYIELSKHFSQELITFTDGSGSQEADPLLELGLKKFGGAFQEIAEFSSLLVSTALLVSSGSQRFGRTTSLNSDLSIRLKNSFAMM